MAAGAKLPPAPAPTSPTTRLAMQANRSRDTGVELAVRRQVHRLGLRYRKHARPVPGLRCEPDMVFSRERVAVFIDGCWWHRCPDHWAPPKANRSWWTVKARLTVERDRKNDQALAEAGWEVVRVWEHEQPSAAAGRVAEVVRSKRSP